MLLEWNFVSIDPTMAVTTLTPKGRSSRRRVSEAMVRTALEALYIPVCGRDGSVLTV